MVSIPRLGRLRLPRIQRNWRAQLRAQRAWWRRRLRLLADGKDVLFPAAGGGVVAVETLRGGSAASGARIAILHATAGSGHKSAAVALAIALGEQAPDAVVREVDTLVFASRFYRTTYAQGYNAMAQRAPRLWGALYALWSQQRVNRSAGRAREAFDRLALRSLVRVVEREHPDAVVCTHFLPVEALSPRRGQGRLRVPLYVVITDFTAHPLWAYPHVDRYFVASPEVAEQLNGHGVPSERIEVAGIPVDPRFSREIGREAAAARFGLDPRKPTVLLMGGGSGVGPMSEVARRLIALAVEPQVVVVCGTNARLLREIQSMPETAAGRVLALGFTHEVDALLEASDVLVSKAGGLTCSEALIKRTPLVVFRPTPGQEVANAQYLETGGAAVHADSAENVATIVARWLADPQARARVRENAGRLAHPHAAETIARRVLEALPAKLVKVVACLLVLLAAMLATLAFPGAAHAAGAPFDGAAALAKARALTPHLVQQQAGPLWAEFDPAMRAAVRDSANLASVLHSIAAATGTLDSVFDEHVERQTSGGFVYMATAAFAKTPAPWTLTSAFDADGGIAGMFVRPGTAAHREAYPSRFLGYKDRTKFHLPVRGDWLVFWGGRTLEQNYHAIARDQRFAHDLLVVKDGRTHSGDGKVLTDYYSYGRPVFAAAAGTVAWMQDSLADNLPGATDRAHPTGNSLILDHGNGEYSLIAHLQRGTQRFRVGDRVRDGAEVGRCGNSGNTSEPHVHFHVQNGPVPFDADGLPVQFVDLIVDDKPVARGELLKGQIVSRAH